MLILMGKTGEMCCRFKRPFLPRKTAGSKSDKVQIIK